jgi:hypothetical protein
MGENIPKKKSLNKALARNQELSIMKHTVQLPLIAFSTILQLSLQTCSFVLQ